jgi:hypothetical protein
MRISRGTLAVCLGSLLIGSVVTLPASGWGRDLGAQGEPRLASRWYQLLGYAKDQTRGDHWLNIAVEDGYCSGERPPHLSGVRVIERPKTTARPFKSAVIQAFVVPAGRAVTSGHELQTQTVQSCAGLGWGVERWIRFKRPLRELFLYDGNVVPPRRVWPPFGVSLREAWAKVERIERKGPGS